MATVYCDEFVKLLNRDEYETIVMVVFDVPAVVGNGRRESGHGETEVGRPLSGVCVPGHGEQ